MEWIWRRLGLKNGEEEEELTWTTVLRGWLMEGRLQNATRGEAFKEPGALSSKRVLWQNL